MGKLDGKVALVTGAAAGIGLAAAQALAGEGAIVYLTDIEDERGTQAVAAITAGGGTAFYSSQDVREEAGWEDIIGRIKKDQGRLDILVNNAGIAIAGSITEMPLEAWQRQNAINIDGVFLGMKHAIPVMDLHESGSIINISSVAGLKGAPGLAGYSGSKGAVKLLTQSVAGECAADHKGVRVNSVHPGIIDTEIWSKMPNGIDPTEGLLANITPQDGANTVNPQDIGAVMAPVGYAGMPQDIANGIVFLASDDSRYMTGSALVIDGGLTA